MSFQRLDNKNSGPLAAGKDLGTTMTMTRSATALAALATGLAAPAAAQDAFAIDEIVVSGALLPLAEGAYGRAFSIVTGEELRARGIRTVQEALRALPGLAVSQTNPTNTQVRIRGGEGNHVLVLIDGVSAASGENGEYFFAGLQTADIERIEVLRGPQSVLYGSNAMTGVISITTKRAAAAGTSVELGAEIGTDATLNADVAVRSRGERGEFAFSLVRGRTGGYDISGEGGETDANEQITGNLTGQYEVAPGVTLGLSFRRTDQSYEFDETNFAATDAASYILDGDDTAERDEMFGALWLEAETADGRGLHRAELAGNSFETRIFSAPGVQSSLALSERREYSYRFSYALDGQPLALSRHRLSFLAERGEEEFRRDLGGTLYARSSNSVALEYLGEIAPGLDLQAGVRHDLNDTFEDATTWNLAASYRMANGMRLHGSVGKAVVNPSLYEQFGFIPATFTGNPDLVPEESLGLDFGVEVPFAAGAGTLDATIFVERLENEIRSTGATVVNDAGTSRRKGLELSADWQATQALSFSASYTYTHARNANGSVEIRRPEHELGLDATLALADGQGSVTLGLRHVSGNFDTQFWGAFATEELPDYTLVDLSGRWAISENAEVVARIENLTDAAHSDVWGYPGQGRAAYVGLRASF